MPGWSASRTTAASDHPLAAPRPAASELANPVADAGFSTDRPFAGSVIAEPTAPASCPRTTTISATSGSVSASIARWTNGTPAILSVSFVRPNRDEAPAARTMPVILATAVAHLVPRAEQAPEGPADGPEDRPQPERQAADRLGP